MQFVNAELFSPMRGLTTVFLNHNQCINENFLNQSRIAIMKREVRTKCSFAENVETTTVKVVEDPLIKLLKAEKKACENLVSAKESQLTTTERFLNKTISEKEVCCSRVTKFQQETAALQTKSEVLTAKLDAAEIAKKEALKARDDALIQNASDKALCDRLDASRNETFAVATQDLRNTLELKLKEIVGLLNKDIKSTETINNQREKIKQLKEKIDHLNNQF